MTLKATLARLESLGNEKVRATNLDHRNGAPAKFNMFGGIFGFGLE